MGLDTSLQDEALRFLRTGRFDRARTTELAAACDQLVRGATQSSNRKALSLGHRFVARSRSEGGELLLTALRACGWALLVAGDYTSSERHYVEARSLVRNDPLARARIDRILVDVYMYLDRTTQARSCARRALAVFRRHDLPADVAKTQVNFANVLHRQDRHSQAGRLYRQAAAYFSQHGPEAAAALCYYNLANTRVQLFDFDEARTLYTSGREIFERHSDLLHATGCLYGLAWLHMLQGEFHQALRELSECESIYCEGKHDRELLLCLLDRAETYLALGLFVDARRLSEEASRLAGRLGLRYESAKSAFFAGRASLGMGRKSEARTTLHRAAAAFRKCHNDGFEAATRFSLAQASQAKGERLRLMEVARRRFARAQLPLWEAMCDLQRLHDQPDLPTVHRRLAGSRAVASVPHLYVSWQTLRGDAAARLGRSGAARRHWTQAALALDAVRSQLPPAEIRTAFMRRESDPFARLIGAYLPHNPGTASAWAERKTHGGRWTAPDHLAATHPERRRIEESLSALASQVAASAGLIHTTGGSRDLKLTSSGKVGRDLQNRLRRYLSELESPSSLPDSTESLERLFEAESLHLPIVQFHLGPRDLIAFVHHGGECHSHRFVDGATILEELVGRWRFLVECAAYAPGRPSGSVLKDELEVLGRLSRWLLPPLELPSRIERLLIVPEGSLVSLPWLALEHHGAMLAECCDVILAPSLHHYLNARLSRSQNSHIRIHVGARQGLEHLDAELDAVRGRFATDHTRVFDPSRRADWYGQDDCGVWHYSGHATLRADNPFYSALELADGPLFAADLRLKRSRVGLVTLAACRTAPHTQLPGDESTGFVRALLEMGASNVVASHWAVADLSTATWMDRFYQHYLGGAAVSRAVRSAALATREKYPDVYHWGAFSAFGCGT